MSWKGRQLTSVQQGSISIPVVLFSFSTKNLVLNCSGGSDVVFEALMHDMDLKSVKGQCQKMLNLKQIWDTDLFYYDMQNIFTLKVIFVSASVKCF